MQMGQKPVEITAGKFCVLNLILFGSVRIFFSNFYHRFLKNKFLFQKWRKQSLNIIQAFYSSIIKSIKMIHKVLNVEINEFCTVNNFQKFLIAIKIRKLINKIKINLLLF